MRPKITPEFRRTNQLAFTLTTAELARLDFVCGFISSRTGNQVSRSQLQRDLVMTTVDKICIAHPEAPKPNDIEPPRSFVLAALKQGSEPAPQTESKPRVVATFTKVESKAGERIFPPKPFPKPAPLKRKRPPSKSK